MAIKSLSIRIDEEMLNKLHVVADYEGRSANIQILILIRDAIEKYEDKHGKIELKKRIGIYLKVSVCSFCLGIFFIILK